MISEKLYKHQIGNNPNDDICIYHEKNKYYDNYLYKTKSNKYVILGHHGTLSTDYQLLDAAPFDPTTGANARRRRKIVEATVALRNRQLSIN